MAQQTAVEWFWLHLEDNISKKYFDLFQQAKEIQKEQTKQAWIAGGGYSRLSEENDRMLAEQYYNETYGDK